MAYNYSQFQPGYYQGNGNGYPQQNPYYPTAVNTQQYSGGGMQTAVPMAQMQQPMNQQSASSGINWVQGRAGANSFYVAPGQSALLMDSEDSVLYVKSVDMTGRPMPLEIYDLVKRDSVVDVPQISQRQAAPSQPAPDMSQYVKTSDLESMVEKYVNKALEK